MSTLSFTESLHSAIVTATRLHAGQLRKGIPYPYIVHPMAVAMILLRYTQDTDTVIAGILHDVLEDVNPAVYSKLDMERQFGPFVTKIVEEVSEEKTADAGMDPAVRKELDRKTWKVRKERYIKGLEKDSTAALMVCAADKIHNLVSMREIFMEQGRGAFEHFNAPMEDKLWFYGRVVEVLRKKLKNPIVGELESTFEEVKRIAEALRGCAGARC